MLKYSWDEWTRLRFVGPVKCMREHQIRTKGTGKYVNEFCLNHDPMTEEKSGEVCPYCKKGLPSFKTYFSNAIIRKLQEESSSEYQGECKRGGCIGSIKNQRFTPIKLVRVTEYLAGKLKQMVAQRAFDFAEPKHGCDVWIKYDSVARVYHARVGDPSKLTKEEAAYFRFPLNKLQPEELDKAKGRMDYLLNGDPEAEHYRRLYRSRKSPKKTKLRKFPLLTGGFFWG